jgi:hypothetical protein
MRRVEAKIGEDRLPAEERGFSNFSIVDFSPK